MDTMKSCICSVLLWTGRRYSRKTNFELDNILRSVSSLLYVSYVLYDTYINQPKVIAQKKVGHIEPPHVCIQSKKKRNSKTFPKVQKKKFLYDCRATTFFY